VMEIHARNTLDQSALPASVIKPLNLDYIPNLKEERLGRSSHPVLYGPSRATRSGTPSSGRPIAMADGNEIKEDIAGHEPAGGHLLGEVSGVTRQGGAPVREPENDRPNALFAGDHDINTRIPPAGGPGIVEPSRSSTESATSMWTTSQSQTVSEGSSWLHQAVVGELIAANIYYLPEGTPSSRPRLSGRPPRSEARFKTTLRDLLDPRIAGAPRISFLLNYLPRHGVAYEDFVPFNGIKPPLNEIRPETLVQKGGPCPKPGEQKAFY